MTPSNDNGSDNCTSNCKADALPDRFESCDRGVTNWRAHRRMQYTKAQDKRRATSDERLMDNLCVLHVEGLWLWQRCKQIVAHSKVGTHTHTHTRRDTHVDTLRRNGGNICHATTNALFHAPSRRNKATRVQCSSRTTNKQKCNGRTDGRADAGMGVQAHELSCMEIGGRYADSNR